MMDISSSLALSEKVSALPATDKDALLSYLCGYVPDAVNFCLRVVQHEHDRREHDAAFGGPELRAAEQFERDNPTEA